MKVYLVSYFDKEMFIDQDCIFSTLESAMDSVTDYPGDAPWAHDGGSTWVKNVCFDNHGVEWYNIREVEVKYPDTPLNQFALAILAGDPVACDAARDAIEKGG